LASLRSDPVGIPVSASIFAHERPLARMRTTLAVNSESVSRRSRPRRFPFARRRAASEPKLVTLLCFRRAETAVTIGEASVPTRQSAGSETFLAGE